MSRDQNSTLGLPPDLAESARDAFGFLQGREDNKVEKLRAALDEGIAELDAGKGQVVEPGELTADIRRDLGLHL